MAHTFKALGEEVARERSAHASAAQLGAWPVLRVALIVVVAAGFRIDAYVHLDLASNYR